MDATPSRVLWLGAGSSFAITRGQLPLTCKLLDQVTTTTYPTLHHFMKSLGPSGENAETLLKELDALASLPVSRVSDRFRGSGVQIDQVKAELHKYFLRRLCGASWESTSWAAQFVFLAGSDATVITTNYDNVAERILSNNGGHTHLNRNPEPSCPHCKMRLLLELDCSCGRSSPPPERLWRGAILKLHGSISWRKCSSGQCDGAQCLIADATCRPFDDHRCTCCGGACEPVLVMPTLERKYLRFPRIAAMWDSAFQALADAEELFIFGFSFPESDLPIRTFLKGALAEGKLSSVHIADVDPEAVWARLRPLLPLRDIRFTALPVERNFATPVWWEQALAEAYGPASINKV